MLWASQTLSIHVCHTACAPLPSPPQHPGPGGAAGGHAGPHAQPGREARVRLLQGAGWPPPTPGGALSCGWERRRPRVGRGAATAPRPAPGRPAAVSLSLQRPSPCPLPCRHPRRAFLPPLPVPLHRSWSGASGWTPPSPSRALTSTSTCSPCACSRSASRCAAHFYPLQCMGSVCSDEVVGVLACCSPRSNLAPALLTLPPPPLLPTAAAHPRRPAGRLLRAQAAPQDGRPHEVLRPPPGAQAVQAGGRSVGCCGRERRATLAKATSWRRVGRGRRLQRASGCPACCRCGPCSNFTAKNCTPSLTCAHASATPSASGSATREQPCRWALVDGPPQPLQMNLWLSRNVLIM